jgi:hypothetical protein
VAEFVADFLFAAREVAAVLQPTGQGRVIFVARIVLLRLLQDGEGLVESFLIGANARAR